MGLFSPAQYEKSYADMNLEEKRVKALEDVIGWLGFDKFVKYTNLARIDSPERPADMSWAMTCYMLGFDGYPVTAWADHIWGFEPEEKEEA